MSDQKVEIKIKKDSGLPAGEVDESQEADGDKMERGLKVSRDKESGQAEIEYVEV